MRGLPGRDEAPAQLVDVARAEHQAQVALAQQPAQDRRGGVEGRQPQHRAPAGGVGGGLGHQQPGDAGEVLGPLARRVDVEHGGDVGPGQRGAELAREPLRARVQVRLEDRDHPPRRQRAGGVDGGGHLGRVVGVVVDHARAAARGPEGLEAPPGAGEVGQRRGGGRAGRRRPARQASRAAAALRALWAPGTARRTACPRHSKREPPPSSAGAGTSKAMWGASPRRASTSGRSHRTACGAPASSARKTSRTSASEP